MRRRRGLGEDERALWSAFVRDVTPLPGRTPRPADGGRAPPNPPPDPSPDPLPVLPPRVPARTVVPAGGGAPPAPPRPPGAGYGLVRSQAAIAIGERRPGMDDTSWRALVSGKLHPTRTLDLHGQHVQAAFQRLHDFLIQARADNIRCVEVITGLGSGRQGGVLRRELPFWLGRPDLRPLILAVTHPHAANMGSVRILLRRRRA